MDKLGRVIGGAARIIDYVGRIGFFGMMMLVTLNVILRKLPWTTSISGAYDYVQLLTASSVAAAIAYTAYERGNIEIEMLMERFSKRIQNIMAAIMSLIVMVFFGLAVRELISLAAKLRAAREVTMSAYVPLYPFLYWIAVAISIMTLVMFYHFARTVVKIVKSDYDEPEKTEEAQVIHP